MRKRSLADLDHDLAAGNQHGVAESLQGSDGLGDEGGLLFDDGVIDGGAETFVEDLDAEQFGTGSGAVLIGAGDGDIEGQDLIGEPGSGKLGSRTFYRGRPAACFEACNMLYKVYIRGGEFHCDDKAWGGKGVLPNVVRHRP